MTTSSKIAVIGPGAIGTTVAAALHQLRRTPALFGRTAKDHLELRTNSDRIVVPGPVQTDPAARLEPAELIFLAVKSTQLQQAQVWLDRLCRPDTVVCVLQNGVEQTEQVRSNADVVPSIVWFPAVAQPDGSVWLRADARLTVPATAAGRTIADALSGSLCSVELAPDFHSLAWRKLLQNAAAGLMVLTGRHSGMFSRPDIAELGVVYLH